MKKRNILVVILCLLIMFNFNACGDKGKTITAPEGKTYSVQLYFVNEEYIVTGDESLDKLMKPVQWEMKSAADKQYEDLINIALRGLPKGNDGYETMITDNIQLNSVTVKDGTALVDLKSEGLQGGSLEEVLLVDQIVETLIGSFSEIKQVQFLVDGKTVDTLMGHLDTSQPFSSKIKKQ